MESKLSQARSRFIAEWGALGTAWGISRSMASIHARLLVAPEPMTTDELMEDLQLSRGNTSTNVRELVAWGLVRQVAVPGERKQFFVAEKEPWRIFVTIVRERLRRELDPALDTLDEVAAMSEGLEGAEAAEFHRVVTSLAGFIRTVRGLARRLVGAESSALSGLARVLS